MSPCYSCPKPMPGRKWRNRLFICDCGQGWRLVLERNYAGDIWRWEQWPTTPLEGGSTPR